MTRTAEPEAPLRPAVRAASRTARVLPPPRVAAPASAGLDAEHRVRRWWRRSRVEVRVRALVLCLAAVALVLQAVAAATALGVPGPDLRVVAVVAALLLLAELPLVQLRSGADHHGPGSWTGAVVVVGLVALPRPWLLLLVGPLLVAGHLLQRRPLLASACHGAIGTVAAGTAALVVAGLVGASRPDAGVVDHVLALAAATLAFSAVDIALAHLVLSVAEDARYVAVLRTALPRATLVWCGNAALALGTLYLLQTSPAVLLGVPPVALVLALTYRAYLRAGQERDAWRHLEVASRELNRLVESEVATAALERGRELFRCDDVELLLDGLDGGPARACRLTARGLEVTAADPFSGPGQTRWVESDGQGRERPMTTSLSTPLDSPSGRIGALRLLFGSTVTLSPRERQVLLTYAQAVSTSLQNARLHQDVRSEAARHAHEASHDALTGLANRTLLGAETERALGAGGGTTALLLLDLDHFKEINDTLGHHAGDQLLQEVSERLRRAVGDAGLVARLGGDEFAVLLTGLPRPEDAEPLAARLLHSLSEPVEFEGLRLSVEASLGLACHPQDADSAADLFRRADVAMYQAKATRGAWLRYDVERDDSSVHRLALVSELRQALERDEICVHVQPQVDLVDGRVVSAEALARWQHPTRGLLLPSDFVGVVEQSGLVRPFTLRILELALQACAQWHADGRPLRIAVNLAARSLLDRSLPDDVAAVLARTGVDPGDLVLEITETTATSELEVVEEVLARLRRTGVEISVDDFGTGYSSLAFLQRTGVDELKVDKSFVRGMLRSDNDAALVRATVQLAHSLGARAVAEGVEDTEHARALRDLGCDVAQGFLYGRPVPPAQLRHRLSAAPVVVPLQGGRRLRLQA